MLPLAPGRFSITTGCPVASESFCPSSRQSTSLDPPGGNGATKRMGFAG